MVIGDLIRRNVKNYPNKIGIIAQGEKYTWKELDERTNALANALISLGFKKQDKIAFLSFNFPRYVEFYQAMAKAGFIAIPLNAWFIGKELSFIINDSEAQGLIVEDRFSDLINSIKHELINIKEFIGVGKSHNFPQDYEALIKNNSKEDPWVEVHEEDIYTIPYTSGTTGRPKGAVLTHKNMCAGSMSLAMETRLVPHYKVMMCTPPFYMGFCGTFISVILRGGCTIVALEKFDPQEVLETIEKEKINFTMFVPTMTSRLVNHPDVDKYDYSSLRTIITSAAPISVDLLKKAISIFGNVYVMPFGTTETVLSSCMLQKEEVSLEGSEAKRLASVGKAAVGYDVRVVNEQGNDIPPGSDQVGEIIIKGDAVTKEYWKLPQETANSIKDGWWHSGDLAKVDEDGYIYIVDRKKDMIVSGGANIYPREIEDVLYQHPAVLHAAVIGVPDEEWGEAVKAVIVLKEGMKATEEEIIEFCKNHLASFKKPRAVDFVDEMPMTVTSKISKKELRDRYWKDRERKVV